MLIELSSYSQSNGWTFINVSGNIRQLAFKGSVGVAVGDNGVIYRSTDSGRDWSALGNYTSDNLVDLKYAGANTF